MPSQTTPDAAGSTPGSPAGGMGRAAVRGTSVTLGGQGLRFAVQLIALVTLTRLLTPADYGIVGMALAIVGVGDILRDLGLNTAAIQAKHLSNAERTNLFWANLGLGAVAAIVAIAASPLIASFYGKPQLVAIVISLAPVFILNGAAGQWRAELSRALRFGALTVSEVGGQIIGLAAGVAVALAGGGYWAIVAQLNVVALTTLMLSGFQSGFRPGLPRRNVSIRRFVRYGGGMLGTQLIAYATRNLDNVAIGKRWGDVELGVYGKAYQVLMMPLNQINAPLTRVALPILSRVHEQPVTYQRYLHRAQMVGCYLTAPLLALIAGLATPIVGVLFGPAWSAVAPILAILAVGGAFRAVAQIAYWIFLAEGLTGSQFKMYLISRPLVIGVMLAGLPWGGIGVAATGSLAYALDWLVQMWWVSRVSKARVAPLLATSVGALIGVGLPVGAATYAAAQLALPNLALLVVGTVAGVAAGAVAALVLPWVRRDVRVMTALIKSGLGKRRQVA